MIQTIDLRGVQPTRAAFQRLVPRPVVDVQVAMSVAADLIADVRERGAAALRDQAERFDGGAPASVRVPPAEIDAAVAALPAEVREALEEAISRVRQATAAQVPPAA
jgi:histidinol dehydrogenase